MQDANLYIPHDDTEAYAAYWTERHVAEVQANPHAVFYNPLRKERRTVDLETVHSALFCLAMLIIFINVIDLVLS